MTESYFDRVQFLPRPSRYFLLVVLLEAMTLVPLRIVQYFNSVGDIVTEGAKLEQIWVLLFFLLAIAFQVYVAAGSVLNEDTVQLGSFLIANLLMVFRAAFEKANSNIYCNSNEIASGDGLCTSTLVISCLCTILFCGISWVLFRAFGWRFYRLVGGDLQLRARYRAYEINNSVLKFDGLFQVLFFMTVSMFALDKTEIILTGVLYLPFALGWGIAVAETSRRENKLVAKCCIALSAVTPIVVIVNIALHSGFKQGGIRCDLPSESLSDRCAVSSTLFVTLGVLVIVARAILMALFWKVFNNFDKGLKDRFHSRRLGAESMETAIPAIPTPVDATLPDVHMDIVAHART